MTTDDALLVPRRLAIALLAEAQRSADGHVRGFIGAQAGVPVSVYPTATGTEEVALAKLRGHGQELWAVFEAGEPTGGRNFENFPVPHLVISLDTKGVLQLRCRPAAGRGPESDRAVRIAES